MKMESLRFWEFIPRKVWQLPEISGVISVPKFTVGASLTNDKVILEKLKFLWVRDNLNCWNGQR
jgi:hypothetical protein